MYIKDSSFYGYVRDTTSASIYLFNPIYATVHVDWDVDFMSGKFDHDAPVFTIKAQTNDQWFYLSCDTAPILTEAERKDFIAGKRKLYVVVIYGVDGNGNLLAPPGTDRVMLVPAEMDEDGFVQSEDVTFKASESGYSVESIHLSELVRVNPEDISDLSIKEKNDIILSSIPFDELNVMLYDEDGVYADFIRRAGKRLRVLLNFEYNQVHSEKALYFYNEAPERDTTSALATTSVKFTGLMGILSTDTFRGAFPHYFKNKDGVFYKEISTPDDSYLETIVSDFNTRHLPIDDEYGDFSNYGGKFLKVNDSTPVLKGTRYKIVGDTDYYSEKVPYYTESPAEGYSYADAIRLLVNAKCHGLRAGGETILNGPIDSLVRDSGAVLLEQEYFQKPLLQQFPKIDKIIVPTFRWTVGEEVELPQEDLDLFASDDTYMVEGTEKKVKWINFGGNVCVSSANTSWPNGGPFFATIVFIGTGDGRLEWKSSEEISGFWPVVVKIVPFVEKEGTTYSKRYGNGKEILTLNNPFLHGRATGYSFDAPDAYLDFNYEQQSGKVIYTLVVRGRFDVHPMDRVLYYDEKGDLRSGIVIEHELSFNGAMKSTYRVLDEGDAPSLYCGKKVLCSETLICRSEKDPDPVDESQMVDCIPIYIGPATTSISDHWYSDGSYTMADFDHLIVNVCDENGYGAQSVKFYAKDIIYGTDTTVIATATVNDVVYNLFVSENWNGGEPYGNFIEYAHCTASKDGTEKDVYFNGLYGKLKE